MIGRPPSVFHLLWHKLRKEYMEHGIKGIRGKSEEHGRNIKLVLQWN